MIDNTGTTTFTYDALDRLTKETLPGSKTNTYTYAASNVRICVVDVGDGGAALVGELRHLVEEVEPTLPSETLPWVASR